MSRTLYLIDGYAQFFRAYYAIRGGMRSPVTGEPTHALFGFTGMLFKLLEQYRPDYLAVVWDAPGRTFRDELYSEYKGTRDAAPDDLMAQVPRLHELMEAWGIPVLLKEGLEADDVIATVTRRVLDDPECADLHVRLVSKDKDLEQLLCDRVCLFDVHTDTALDVAGLLEKRGITPEQVVDYLTLTGDSVDNVPGAQGIGPKTAAELLKQFGTLEGIFAGLESLKGKRRENLEAFRAQAPLSRELVTLRCDPEFPCTLEELRVRPLEPQRLIPLFQELGFNRFQDEARRHARVAAAEAFLAATAPEEPAGELETAESGRYEAVTTAAALAELVRTLRAQPLVAVDTETTGLERDAQLCGLSFAWEAGHGVYVPTRSPEPETHLDTETVLDALRPLLEDPTLPKCGHNVKFDARVLRRNGVRLRGVVLDSMLASQLLDPSKSTKLDHLAESLLRHRMIPLTDLLGEKKEGTIDAVPLDRVTPYAAEDADITLRLCRLLEGKLEELGLARLMREVEAPLSVVLAEMEECGILCDPEELQRQGADLGIRVDALRVKVQELAGCEFQLDSPKQLSEVLFDRLGFTSGKKTKTGRSTDIEVLEKLAAQEDRNDPRTSVPRLIIEYRQLAKLINTYLGNLRDSVDSRSGRIHTTFHQLVTATGRLASHGPNLQNIPVRSDQGRQVRKAFHAPQGHLLLCADYSQVELRVLAHLSEDPGLLAAFLNGEDIHTAVAAQVFGVRPEEVTREQRGHAKTINFGIIYGVTPFGLARRIEGLDVGAAAQLIAEYQGRFPGIQQFLDQCVCQATDHGYVSTILGRRRAIPEIHAPSRTMRALGERLAINSVVQGSAADLIKIAMVNVQRRVEREDRPLRLLLQIHDELVFETPEALAQEHAALVCEEMERALELRVPLKAEAGIARDWMTAK
ncbi:MAG: DNA polymerase I [Armatimonadota bacterium]